MSLQISSYILTAFMKYFSGNTERYGRHIYSDVIEKGKKEEGQSFWVKDKNTDKFIAPNSNAYKNHLEGKAAMGICPIREDNKTNFVVIDYDVYDINLTSVVNNIYENNFPLLCFRSKSGGLHIYLFFEEPIQSKDARKIAKKFLFLLGFKSDTEIFPKHDKLKSNSHWINIPYFNCEKPLAYLYGNNLEQISLLEALNIIKDKAQSPEKINDFFKSLDYSDAPPCLQCLSFQGVPKGGRNNFMFNLGVYFKSKYGTDNEFVAQMINANKELPKPLPDSEINKIIESHKKGTDYSYKCNDEPICDYCNKTECRSREFGIDSEVISELNYGQLTQYKTESDPYYEWIINDVKLTFRSANEIIKQEKFIEQCFEKLHFCPHKLKNQTWVKIINKSLLNMIVIEVNESNDMSPKAMFKSLLKEFIICRQQAVKREQLKIGKVWYCDDDGAFYFKKEALVRFLKDKQFTDYSRQDIQREINQIGYKHRMRNIIRINSDVNGTVRVVGIPKSFITPEDYLDLEEKAMEVDFEKYKDEPF